jgi:hypothetical protein
VNTITINALQIDALLHVGLFTQPLPKKATAARVDVDAEATPEVREPDFIDPCGQVSTAVWIGADAAVEMSVDLLADLSLLVYQGGLHARHHRLPGEFGITVTAHNPGYVHPAGGSLAYRDWRMVTDTLEG